MPNKKVKVLIEVDESEIFRSVENVGVDPLNPHKDLYEPVVTNVFVIGKQTNGYPVRVDIIDIVDMESLQ